MSDPTETPSTEPDAAAVAQLLADENDLKPADAEAPKVELDESTASEVRAAVSGQERNEAERPKVDVPMPSQWAPDMQNLQQYSEWLFSLEALGKIEVEDHEKAVYLKALMHDAMFAWDITFELQQAMTVKVQSLSSFGQQATAAAMRLDEDDKIITGLQSMASMMQQYTILQQVVSIDDRPFPIVDTSTMSNLEETATLLRAKVREVMWAMNSAKLNLLVKAVTIFEIKQKLCNDAIVNRDRHKGFWSPPDIA